MQMRRCELSKDRRSMADIIQFKVKRPSSILPYINQTDGWKFAEKDKDFLVQFYLDWIKALKEDADGDFIQEPTLTLESLMKNGVEESKDLVQMDAVSLAESVNYNIYEFYSCNDTLKFIENSILTVVW